MPDVFLSYAREDRPRAGHLADALAARGWTVWWDREIEYGQAFDLAIEKALEETRCVVVLWSPAAVQSRWVRAEAEDGAGREILVQALLEGVTLPLGVRALQAVDLSTWRGEAQHDGLQRLVAAVESVLGTTAPTPAWDPADELRILRTRMLAATPFELQRLGFEIEAFLERYPAHPEARHLRAQVERAAAPPPVAAPSARRSLERRWAHWPWVLAAMLALGLLLWWLL